MPTMTLKLSERAAMHLRKKAPGRIGRGAYVSEVLVAEAVREECQRTLKPHTAARTETWDESGCNVED